MNAGKLQPKKATSAYFAFNLLVGPRIREEQKLSVAEAAKKVAELWKGMSEADKKPYTDKAAKDKARFDKELKELSSKGFFKLPDGRKSSDIRVP